MSSADGVGEGRHGAPCPALGRPHAEWDRDCGCRNIAQFEFYMVVVLVLIGTAVYLRPRGILLGAARMGALKAKNVLATTTTGTTTS